MSKETGILFSAPMVRAILEGRKTQTRRIIKAARELQEHGWTLNPITFDGTYIWPRSLSGTYTVRTRCPYRVGNLLWVRETWYPAFRPTPTATGVIFRADYGYRPDLPEEYSPAGGWRPSIFMPKWAARIWLEITGVRVQRVQEISEEDVEAEGLYPKLTEDGEDSYYEVGKIVCDSPVEAYQHLWDSLNKSRGYGWDVNPWVWVVEFKRIEGRPPESLRQRPGERSGK